MDFKDIKIGDRLKVGPYPGTTSEPWHGEDSDDDPTDYVAPEMANAVVKVVDLNVHDENVDVELLGGSRLDQWIHAAHLEPVTA